MEQFRAGTIDFNRVFNLETTQVQQQDRLAASQGDIALNLIGVYRGLGGGWELRLQQQPAIEGRGPAEAADLDVPTVKMVPQSRPVGGQEGEKLP